MTAHDRACFDFDRVSYASRNFHFLVLAATKASARDLPAAFSF
jgi:hypothetical protein